VDQDDNVLDILVQSRRNKKAAKKFFRKLLKALRYAPRVVISDKLRSYGAAKREILPGVEHRQSRYLNNRCENSHRPTRQRERRMQGFESPGHAQRFLSAYGLICQHFRPRRHLLSAAEHSSKILKPAIWFFASFVTFADTLHRRKRCHLIRNPATLWACGLMSR
jgi:putative transposase